MMSFTAYQALTKAQRIQYLTGLRRQISEAQSKLATAAAGLAVLNAELQTLQSYEPQPLTPLPPDVQAKIRVVTGHIRRSRSPSPLQLVVIRG